MSADGQQQQPGVKETRLVIRSRSLTSPDAAPELPAPESPGPGDHLAMIENALQSGSDEALVPHLTGRAHVVIDGQHDVIPIGWSDEVEEKFANMEIEEMRRTLKNLALHAHGQEVTTQTHANLLHTINKGGLDLSLQVQNLRKPINKRQEGPSISKAQRVINNRTTELIKKNKRQLAYLDEANKKQTATMEEHATTGKQQAAEIAALKSMAEEQAATLKQQAAEIEDLKATVMKLVSCAEAREAQK